MSGQNNYEGALKEQAIRIAELRRQKAAIELELRKLRTLARATINMLPAKEQDKWTEILNGVLPENTQGLTDSMTGILATNDWMSPPAIRDALVHNGFSFEGYTSNPLASVHAVLKRLLPDKLETRAKDGVTEYRWKMLAAPTRKLTMPNAALVGEEFRKQIERQIDYFEKGERELGKLGVREIEIPDHMLALYPELKLWGTRRKKK